MPFRILNIHSWRDRLTDSLGTDMLPGFKVAIASGMRYIGKK
jgi:hypothetical protein